MRMVIVRSLELDAARTAGGLKEVYVDSLEEARDAAKGLLPMRLRHQALICINSNGLIVHIGGLEDETCIRCWTPIADGKAYIPWKFRHPLGSGNLCLGHPQGEEAPLLFDDGLVEVLEQDYEEVKEGTETKEGKVKDVS